jgi:hypothetical protein
MPRVGFEPTISVLEWAKTVCTLDHAATMIGILGVCIQNFRQLGGRANFLRPSLWSHLSA